MGYRVHSFSKTQPVCMTRIFEALSVVVRALHLSCSTSAVFKSPLSQYFTSFRRLHEQQHAPAQIHSIMNAVQSKREAGIPLYAGIRTIPRSLS